jgi:hypothetical protein
MDSETWAFIDEYGNPNLDTDVKDVSTFFIVSAVILDGSVLAEVRAALELVRHHFFQTGELKSAKLKDNRNRWIAVLSALAPIPFKFAGFVVDKRRLDKDKYQWKQSFYKNLCGRLYSKLMKAFPALRIRADRFGTDEFKQSFANYIAKNHRPTLFDRGTFEFLMEGEDDLLVQLADILCGLLARCYDPKKQLSAPEELLRIVSDNALLIDEWPPRFRVTGGRSELSSKVDDRIAEYSLQQAEDFIVKHEDDQDEIVRCQVAVLEQLVFERRFGEEARNIATGALIDNLRARGLGDRGETWFRMNVIAPLRDQGLLLTSSSSGYKLPTCPEDLSTFVNHAETVCIPMLQRVNAACKAVKLATQGQVDVLAQPERAAVRALVAAIHQSSGDQVPSTEKSP